MCDNRTEDLKDMIDQMEIAIEEDPKNADKYQKVIDVAEIEIAAINYKEPEDSNEENSGNDKNKESSDQKGPEDSDD